MAVSPEDPEDLHADAGEPRGGDDADERERYGQGKQEWDCEQYAERRHPQHPARAEPEQDQPADEEAERLYGQDEAPGGGATEMLLGDHWTEHVLGALLDRVDETELRDDRPEPRPGAELAPAFRELGEEVRSLHAQARREPDQADEQGREEETRGITGKSDAGICRGHDQPAKRRPADPAGVGAEAKQSIRALQHRPGNRLGDNADRSREEEGGAQPVHRSERHQLPDLSVAEKQERGDRRLTGRR